MSDASWLYSFQHPFNCEKIMHCVRHRGSKNPSWLHRLVDVGDWVRWCSKDTRGYCNCCFNLRTYSPPRFFYFCFCVFISVPPTKTVFTTCSLLKTSTDVRVRSKRPQCRYSSHARRPSRTLRRGWISALCNVTTDFLEWKGRYSRLRRAGKIVRTRLKKRCAMKTRDCSWIWAGLGTVAGFP